MKNVKCVIQMTNVVFQSGKRFALYIIHFAIFLFFMESCNNNSAPKTAEFGETDSLSIAEDTIMQVAIENSHEFLQTLTVSPEEVYDIKSSAYFEGVEHKKFLILRRTKGNVEDTLCEQTYPTEITRTELVDLDNDKVKEILIYYTTNTVDPKYTHIASLLVCKPARKGHADFLIEMSGGAKEIKYKSSDAIHDTLYVKDNLVVRKYPLYEFRKDTLPKGTAWIYYQLKFNKFEEVKKEAVL